MALSQTPQMKDLVASTLLQNEDNQLTVEEKLAQDKQALYEQQAYLTWKKTCAAQNIDDFRCQSLWNEQQELNEAKKELESQQAAINEQKRLEAEQAAAAEAQAAEEEATRQQLIAQQQEALRQQQLAEKEAQKQAYLQSLATPKAGYIEITSADLNVGSASSVTIHNLHPNTCNGANWCNNVTIDYVYVDGVKMTWHGANPWNLMAEDSYTKNFYGATDSDGVVRVTGHYGSQVVFAEYVVGGE